MRNPKVLRAPHRLAASIVLSTFLAACGGGGGGGDSGGGAITDDPAPPMPTIVSFGIGTKDVAPLTFTVANVADVSIAYTLLGFNGTWNRTAQAYSLSGRTNVLSGPNLFGDFVVQTIEPLTWAGDNPPGAGKMEVLTVATSKYPLLLPVVTTIDGMAPPVLLGYGADTVRYDWDTYLSLWPDDTEPTQWRVASFGATALSLAIDRVRAVLDLMAFINGNDRAIAAAGAAGLETACSPRPGATTGSRRIALANPDGELNPGDGLVVTYTNCWIDDPTDDIDLLLDGTITMSGYIENASPFSTGFDEIHFVSLTIWETETAGGLVNIDPDPIVVTGKLGLFVTP